MPRLFNMRSSRITRSCKICSKEFKPTPYSVRHGNGFFCSHSCAMKGKAQPSLEDRFWKKVEKKSPDECWEFKGAKYEHGYGCLSVGGRKNKGAHRISYVIHFGEIPNDLHVLHKCDNPPCVNPNHLFLGTHKQNMEDKSRKGRCAPRKKRIIA